MLICQVAKEKYMVEQIIARVNNPRNKQWFELLGISPVVSATDLILRLIEHEVPKYGLVHLLDLPQERLEIIELLLSETSPVDRAAGGGPRAARGEPADLGAARRDGVRARAGDGAGGRRRGARRPRSGPRGGAEGLHRPRRLRASERWPTAGSTTCWSAGSPRRTARRSFESAGPTGRSCWSGASPTRRTSGRRSRRSTCAARASEEDAYVNPAGLVRGERRRAADRDERDVARRRRRGRRSSRPRRRSSSARR